jgi:hypothetical protein
MIVLLNTVSDATLIPLTTDIATHLSRRYGEQGRLVAGHHDRQARSLAEMAALMASDAVSTAVAQMKREGGAHIVVNGAFLTPGSLRQLRVALSAYDDEIYAFCLPLSETLLSQLTAPGLGDALADLVAQWGQAQQTGARVGDMGYEIVIQSLDPAETAGRIWDDIHAPVELVDYQDAWPDMFACENASLLEALPATVIGVEHIGSTAIPGMPAKPIIDILVVVDHLDEVTAFIDYASYRSCGVYPAVTGIGLCLYRLRAKS